MSNTAVKKAEREVKKAERKAKERATLAAINLSDKRLRLFNEKEACAVLGISPVTLWRLRRAGRISFARVNNSLRYSERDISEFLERTRRSSGVV